MDMKRSGLIVFLVVGVAVAAVLLGLAFGNGKQCNDFECFSEIMESCNYGNYLNEGTEASWKYQIIGKDSKGNCKIEVTLLQVKQGDAELRTFEGNGMVCVYPKGVSAYPDKDLSLCSGKLKENLQDVLIKKLHEYILDNLDDVKAGLA